MIFSFQNPLPWVPTDGTPLSEAITSDEYFIEKFLNRSDGLFDIQGYQPWIALSFLIVSVITFLIIYKGIDTAKYTVYLTVPLPYILITIFFFKGMTLEGNTIGWKYLFTPDWSKLFTTQIWIDAVSQTLFSAGLGHNTILKFATHRKESDKILLSSIVVPALNFATSIFSAIALFSFVGYASNKTGIPIKEMPVGGMELVFVVYPAILSSLPLSTVWSVLFFTMMVALGLCTQYIFIECVSKLIYGTCKYRKGFKTNPTTVTAILCSFIFILNILFFSSTAGYYWLEVVDHNATAVNLPIFLFFQIIFFAYLLPLDALVDKVKEAKEEFPKLYRIALKTVCPIFSLLLLAMIVYQEIDKLTDTSKPLSEKIVGYTIFATPCSLFFIIAIWNPLGSTEDTIIRSSVYEESKSDSDVKEKLINQSH